MVNDVEFEMMDEPFGTPSCALLPTTFHMANKSSMIPLIINPILRANIAIKTPYNENAWSCMKTAINLPTGYTPGLFGAHGKTMICN